MITSTAEQNIQDERILNSLTPNQTDIPLAIAEPTALPIAIPEFPIKLAVAETASSGMVVARLTIVPPMTMRGILKRRAITILDSTNSSPTLNDQAKPYDK